MILDCTFRDGGYYVNWDFDEKIVLKYLESLSLAKVDIIEMGFRFLKKNKFLGAFAYTTDSYLKSLPLPEKTLIAVMVNADELIKYSDGLNEAVKILFKEKKGSPVDIVRVAAHIKDISLCKELIILLNDLGYRVCLNIMQIDSISYTELNKIVLNISNWETKIEALYFADSFGNMEPETVKETIETIKSCWSGNIGFHSHDNKGQALSNCITAFENGVNYIDGTIYGMGRGAGNVKTENLLIELKDRGYGKYFADAVFPLVTNEFQYLKEKYKWGSNVYYHLSAIYGIHPTYIQEMLNDSRYRTENILSTINFLRESKAPSFSPEILIRASNGIEGNEKGNWSAKNFCNDRTILIVGSGQSSKKYIKDLKLFINNKRPIVLCLNINHDFPSKLVDYYIACHDFRILIESTYYNKLGKPLIMPISRVPDEIYKELNDIKVLDYGLRLKQDSFEIGEYGCLLSKPLALSYAISIAHAGGTNNILLTGIDGYDSSDPRQHEMIEIIEQYSNLKGSIPLTAITPTTYPIRQTSIFDPFL